MGSFKPVAQETDSLQLNGISLGSKTGFGLTAEQGEALFRFHQGKPAHFSGILEKITVKGNTADIELYPVSVSFALRDCNKTKGKPASACFPPPNKLVSVTCRVNDWASLNQKTAGDILVANQLRRKGSKERAAFPFIKLEGTLAVSYTHLTLPTILLV